MIYISILLNLQSPRRVGMCTRFISATDLMERKKLISENSRSGSPLLFFTLVLPTWARARGCWVAFRMVPCLAEMAKQFIPAMMTLAKIGKCLLINLCLALVPFWIHPVRLYKLSRIAVNVADDWVNPPSQELRPWKFASIGETRWRTASMMCRFLKTWRWQAQCHFNHTFNQNIMRNTFWYCATVAIHIPKAIAVTILSYAPRDPLECNICFPMKLTYSRKQRSTAVTVPTLCTETIYVAAEKEPFNRLFSRYFGRRSTMEYGPVWCLSVPGPDVACGCSGCTPDNLLGWSHVPYVHRRCQSPWSLFYGLKMDYIKLKTNKDW